MITNKFRVDQYDNVYDGDGEFFCKWEELTPEEKAIVKENPASAY